MTTPFLTARWENVLLFNFEAPQKHLMDLVPPGMHLDTRNKKAFVSLVAFGFHNTRIKGLAIPFHTDFPEINLRYYLRYQDKRGVAFIRELVPKTMIAAVARWLYNEPYVALPMQYSLTSDGGRLQAEHTFRYKSIMDNSAKTGRIWAAAVKEPSTPADDSTDHFFKEHTWGFGRLRNGQRVYYKVDHPVWQTYPLRDYQLDVDFAALYGARWGFLTTAKPVSAVWAAGSEVAVYNKKPLDEFGKED